MPRIRKKTSKRGTTNKRARIQHKVAESRKKTKKAAKKDPQWKSKHKKDPGIPNNFPYKDQILAEVAEERRKAVEEKQRRKEEKKARVVHDENLEVAGSDEEPTFGVATVNARTLTSSTKEEKSSAEKKANVGGQHGTEEGGDSLGLINHGLPNLKSVLDLADVVVEVLDARDPLSFRSAHLEELAAARPAGRTLLVLNKIDTCPREAVMSWATQLRSQHPTLLIRAASSFLPHIVEPAVKAKGKANEYLDDALGVDSVLECLGRWAQGKDEKDPLVVAVVGLVNAGKTSFINSLLRHATFSIYSLSSSSPGPTTTTLPQEVTIEVAGRKIRIIDTPGISWSKLDDQTTQVDTTRVRDVLLRNKGRIDRLKDPTLPIAHIVSRSNNENLMLLYNLPAFTQGDSGAFLAGVARSRHLVLKRGALDLIGASRIVLRDWSTGKFPWFTVVPPPGSVAPPVPDAELADIYAKDERILSTLTTRKDMRRSKGLVQFTSGEIDSRRVALEEPWAVTKQDDSENEGEGEDEDEDAVVDLKDDDDSISAEHSEGMEDIKEATTQTTSRKERRKRAAESVTTSSPKKKVAFASGPAGSRQARSRTAEQKTRRPAVANGKGSVKPKSRSDVPKRSKVANTVAALQKSVPREGGGVEAYDFSKFF